MTENRTEEQEDPAGQKERRTTATRERLEQQREAARQRFLRSERKLAVRDAKPQERDLIVWLRKEMVEGRIPVDFDRIKETLSASFDGFSAEETAPQGEGADLFAGDGAADESVQDPAFMVA